MSEEVTAPVTGAETPAPAPVEAPVMHESSRDAMSNETTAAEATAKAEANAQEDEGRAKAKERLSLRFSELTNQRKAAEEAAQRKAEEAEYWRQQALARQAEPDISHGYDDGDQDINALVERAVEARLKREAEERAQKAQAETVQTMRSKLLESGLEGAALIAMGDGHFTQPMFDALTVSERPAELADFLGRNQAEAARIAALTPAQQGVELARLEARLATQPRTTSAPPPPPTVGGRAVASLDPSSMSFEQYKAARESGQL